MVSIYPEKNQRTIKKEKFKIVCMGVVRWKPKNTRKLTDYGRVRLLATSKRFGCPIRIRIEATNPNNPTGPWPIAYTRDGSRAHNHPPSFDVPVHVAHRQKGAW